MEQAKASGQASPVASEQNPPPEPPNADQTPELVDEDHGDDSSDTDYDTSDHEARQWLKLKLHAAECNFEDLKTTVTNLESTIEKLKVELNNAQSEGTRSESIILNNQQKIGELQDIVNSHLTASGS